MITVYIGNEQTSFLPIQRHAKISESLIRRSLLENRPIKYLVRELRLPSSSIDPRGEFAYFAKQISQWLREDNLTVVVSEVTPTKLNPVAKEGPENLFAMLILAFPEARWLFGTIRGYDEKVADAGTLDGFRAAHGLQGFLQPERSSVYDGSGLRDWVRQRAVEHSETKDNAKYLPRRIQRAVALDEETNYANLHAYTAYRFGYRATPISTFSLAVHLLSEGANKRLDLVFEDIYTNFPDGVPGVSKLYHDSRPGVPFKGRAAAWPQVAKADCRILITSGRHDNPERWESNRSYLLEQRAAGRHIQLLFKPYAGIFRLWDGAGLKRKIKWQDGESKWHLGVAEGYIWPPKDDRHAVTDDQQSGHSAPGVLLVVAEALIRRAEILTSEVKSLEDTVLGAVLATDALELLGGRTPTLAVQALRLKHHFEVLAECRFSGVEHHFLVRDRLLEIHRDVQAISKWFGKEQQTCAALNAEMHVLDALVEVFRDNSQFDEEQTCRNRMLHLHNTMWMLPGNGRQLAWPFLRYTELLLSSFRAFVVAIASWILIFSSLFFLAQITSSGPGTSIDSNSFERAYAFFFGGAVPAGAGFLESLVTLLATVIGLGHLGIFLAHLYNLVSRK